MAQLPLNDVDCTIEGTQIDFGAPRIESAEESIAKFGEEMMVRRRREIRFVVNAALQGSGAQIEGIPRREAHLNYAAVVFKEVGSIGHKLAVEKDVPFRGLGPHV